MTEKPGKPVGGWKAGIWKQLNFQRPPNLPILKFRGSFGSSGRKRFLVHLTRSVCNVCFHPTFDVGVVITFVLPTKMFFPFICIILSKYSDRLHLRRFACTAFLNDLPALPK